MKKQNNTINLKFLFASFSILRHRLLRTCSVILSFWEKERIITLVLSVFMASISVQALSQTETFDIATYKPPKDFKKEAKPGVVNYTNVNTTTGGFCVIAMFASTASTGDAEKDFDKRMERHWW